MNIAKKITKNKSLEIGLFQKGWPNIIDLDLSWTTKRSGQDHWGITLYLVLFGWTDGS